MFQDIIEFTREHFNIPIYFISLLISLANYRKFFDTVLKYLPALIAYTFFNELLGYFIRYSDKFAFFEDITFANDLIYNIYDLFYYGFFFWVFWKLVNSIKLKNAIKTIAILALCLYIISSFFQNPLVMTLYYATTFSSFALAISTMLYWANHWRDWKWNIEKHNLMFWISFGLFAFHLTFSILYLRGTLNPEIWYKYNFQMILRLSIVIMYTLFCIGFIVSKRRAFR